jgi:putative pyruvate formate lyase activating enzyme
MGGERGYCGAGGEVATFMDYVHWGEEEGLSPSHTVFLTGCNLRCVFCHTATDRNSRPARRLGLDSLEALAARGRDEGALNINFLGGEPTASLPSLVGLISRVDDLPPVVWNTNSYFSGGLVPVLESFVSFYLADLKFGCPECGAQAADAGDYWDVARERVSELVRAAGDRVIVRHLVIPSHLECCTRPALEWIARRLPGARVSLRGDYMVAPGARSDPRLGRFLTRSEAEDAAALARSLGLRLVGSSPLTLPPEGDGSTPDRGEAMDVEFVISPAGNVYVRHPVRQAMELGLARDALGHPEEGP